MPHWDKNNFAKDLETFLELIQKYELPVDVSKVYDFQSNFLYRENYLINVEDIVFYIDKKISGTVPFEIAKISVFFNHTCEFDIDKNPVSDDLIKSNYRFSLKIAGYDNDKNEYNNWWRLDQDIEGDQEHKCTHPYYHFQAGGDELYSIDTGKTIFTGAPRLSHPPMDIFLGFHFVLNNFYNRKEYSFINKLFSDENYQDIIMRAQKRLWVPYFGAFNHGTTHSNFTMAKVFPLYIN